ncbi:MAG: helix-turn-helix domain-containing protein [Pseudonocardiaceae bacterium]
MTEPESFGQYVWAARKAKGYSDRQLGKHVRAAHTTISRIENGSIPEPGLFLSLIDALDLDIITAVTLIDPYRRIYQRIVTALEVK